LNVAALYDLADRENIAIDEFPMKHKVSLSLMDNDGNCYIAIDTLQLDSAQSEKIILAHELGHCMTGSFYNKYAACDIRKRHENHADKWSFANLVPEKELREAVSAGFTEPWQLAEYFDVPCDYIVRACHWYKYHNMDIIA
jgi:Zn-dependent peptidase ImmA (M78 family)